MDDARLNFAGGGTLTLADGDTVDITNPQRQILRPDVVFFTAP